MKKLLAIALLLAAGPLFAQTVPGSLRADWTLPTTGCTTGVSPCDNAPLTGTAALTGVEVYISTSPIPDSSLMAPTLTLPAGATTASHTMQVANGSTLYVRTKAVNGSGKSAFSVQSTKLVQVPVIPGVPTNVTITLTITP